MGNLGQFKTRKSISVNVQHLGCLPISNAHFVSGPTETVGSGWCDVQQEFGATHSFCHSATRKPLNLRHSIFFGRTGFAFCNSKVFHYIRAARYSGPHGPQVVRQPYQDRTNRFNSVRVLDVNRWDVSNTLNLKNTRSIEARRPAGQRRCCQSHYQDQVVQRQIRLSSFQQFVLLLEPIMVH